MHRAAPGVIAVAFLVVGACGPKPAPIATVRSHDEPTHLEESPRYEGGEVSGEVSEDELEGEDAAAEGGAAGTFVMRNFAIAPGKFAELNVTMAAGSRAVAKFRGDGIVAWDVHSHPAAGVRIHDSGEAPSGEVELVAEADGGYSFLWKNTGNAPVELVVSVELGPGVTVDSWVPDR